MTHFAFPRSSEKNAKHDSFKNCLLQTKSRLFPPLSFSSFYVVFLSFFLFVFQYCFPGYLILYVFLQCKSQYLTFDVSLSMLTTLFFVIISYVYFIFCSSFKFLLLLRRGRLTLNFLKIISYLNHPNVYLANLVEILSKRRISNKTEV